jgi:citrate lyase subunit beta/citryl-CoA lyase
MVRAFRPRRSCLAVPGSSPRFIAKARDLPADQVFFDLEDAVAPDAKDEARVNVAEALAAGDLGGKVRAVRINDATTQWAYRDVVDVVETVGFGLDCVILPKVSGPGQIGWLDLLLTQLERAMGYEEGGIGIEAQIEDAAGLSNADAIAGASARLEALVFGPADFMASIGMKSLDVGEQPPGYDHGDAYHYALMRILVAARGHGLQAIDGPYLKIRDAAGFRRSAGRSAALGYDGKWVLHPGQIGAANDVYSPQQSDYEHAEMILDAFDYYTKVQRRGAVMLGDEMIDEASRKMAMVVVAKGRAAGLSRHGSFEPPDDSPF